MPREKQRAAHFKAHIQRNIRKRAYAQADEDHQAIEVPHLRREITRRRKRRGQRRGQGLERERGFAVSLGHGAETRRHQHQPRQGDI